MENNTCFLCGEPAHWNDPLDRHHIFGGSLRKKSEEYGLVVYLHHNKCHIFGKEAVHNNAKNMLKLKQYGQAKAMAENNWTIGEFRQHFRKNYIEEN